MPEKIEYQKEDGSIGTFNDWTEEWNEAQSNAEQEILNNPEKMKALDKRFKKFEEVTRKKAKEKQK